MSEVISFPEMTPEEREVYFDALRELYRRNFEIFAKDQLTITSVEPGKFLHLYPFTSPQQILHNEAEKQRKEDGWIRIVFIKGRQFGSSTYCVGRAYHLAALNPAVDTLHLACDDDTVSSIFTKAKLMHDRVADEIRPLSRFDNKKMLRFENPDPKTRPKFPGLASQMRISHAKNVLAGTGTTGHFLHLCLSPESLIEVDDGDLAPIKEVKIGSTVRTHGCNSGTVSAIHLRQAKDLIRIRTWLSGSDIELTLEHKVWTRFGWKEAQQLTKKDELAFPLPQRNKNLTYLTIQPKANCKGPKTKSGIFPLDLERGYVVGYYLAEGWITSGPNGPSGIAFAHHQNEQAYADRAIRALGDLISSSRTDHFEGYRANTTVYSSTLGEFFLHHFGKADSKRIPSWVFDSPDEFLWGLLLGYICGDGSKGFSTSKGYEDPSIYITSTRPRLVVQLRYILGILGIGWGGLHFKEAFVDDRGWNCKAAVTLCISGKAAITIRKRLGWTLAADSERRSRAQKYKLEDGYVWVKVKELESIKRDGFVYDLTIEHPDHSFTTVCGIVKNSEAAKYNSEVCSLLESSIFPSLHLKPGTVCINESTAYVRGDYFRSCCDRAMSGKSEWRFVFVPWYFDARYFLPLKKGEKFKLSAEEKRIQKIAEAGQTFGKDCKYAVPPYTITPEQFNWRRIIIAGREDGENIFKQEYPATFDESWITFDIYVFNRQKLYEMRDGLSNPKRFGRITDDGRVLDDETQSMGEEDSYFAIWEEPQPGERYDIGLDTSAGLEHGDFCVAEIIKRRTQEQVAEFRVRLDAMELGEKIYFLGKFYNTAQISLEMANTGFACNAQLQRLGYPYLYIWRHRERSFPTLSSYTGWKTTRDSKSYMLSLFTSFVNKRTIKIRSRILWNEMFNYIKVPGMSEGYDQYMAERGYDDCVMAFGIGLVASDDETFGRHSPDERVAKSRKELIEEAIAKGGPAFNDDLINRSNKGNFIDTQKRWIKGFD